MNVLVVVAHPDDAELAIGGTLQKHIAKGDKIHVLCVTDGEYLAHGRAEETIKSVRLIGGDTSFLHLPDTKVSFGVSTITKIEEIVKKVNPYRVYTHSQTDMHQDHQNTCKSTLVASREVPQILLFSSPEHSIGIYDFNPKYYIDISKYMDRKIKISKLHKSVNSQKDYFDEKVIRGEASYWGSKIKVDYAECFEVFKFIESK